jgi:hypothetical protein
MQRFLARKKPAEVRAVEAQTSIRFHNNSSRFSKLPRACLSCTKSNEIFRKIAVTTGGRDGKGSIMPGAAASVSARCQLEAILP